MMDSYEPTSESRRILDEGPRFYGTDRMTRAYRRWFISARRRRIEDLVRLNRELRAENVELARQLDEMREIFEPLTFRPREKERGSC